MHKVMVRCGDYPQLRQIAWECQDDALLTQEEAFTLYERRWGYVDAAALTPSERAFIEKLTNEVGGGYFCV